MEAEKNRKRIKAWKKANPGKVREQAARHYKAHAERLKEAQRNYYGKLTPEQKRARANKQRDRRLQRKLEACPVINPV